MRISLNMIVPRLLRRGLKRNFATSLCLKQPVASDASATSQKSSRRSPADLIFVPTSSRRGGIKINYYHLPYDHSSETASKKSPTKIGLPLEPSKVGTRMLDKPDPIWLRDSCKCPFCVDSSNKQKLFQTSDIPSNIEISTEEILPDESYKVTWSNDIQGYGGNHISIYPKKFFKVDVKRKVSGRTALTPHIYWDNALISKDIKFIDFNRYMSEESALWDVLEQLRKYGLVFIRGVPASDTAVEHIGSRIGPLRHTFYGRTWDVKSVPEAKNIAYTHQYLGLHMDLLYMENPPYLQLLHCIQNSCEGGSSIFSDSFAAAQKLLEDDPEAFRFLTRYSIPYHYENAGEEYHTDRPVITLTKEGKKGTSIGFVNWSPPFQGQYPLTNTFEPNFVNPFRSLHGAMKKFATHIEAPGNIYEYRMKEGDCVIFNNRRVLHARRAFDISSGKRWLKGAYLDRDVYKSRWNVLQKSHGISSEPSAQPQTA